MEVIGILCSVLTISVVIIIALIYRVKFLRIKVEHLEWEKRVGVRDGELEIEKLKRKISRIQNKFFYVGSTFYYPSSYNFKPELVNKRAKIIGISNGVVSSRLIDDDGNFVDDNIWTGSVESSLNYIYEKNNRLMFNFN